MLTFWSEGADPQPEHYCCIWCKEPLSTCDCRPHHGQWCPFRIKDKLAGWVLIDSEVASKLSRRTATVRVEVRR
jgi:hypothetical protein